MAHSKNFEKVKRYYNTYKANGSRLWNITMVRNAVVKGWITTEEYEDITGEKCEAD